MIETCMASEETLRLGKETTAIQVGLTIHHTIGSTPANEALGMAEAIYSLVSFDDMPGRKFVAVTEGEEGKIRLLELEDPNADIEVAAEVMLEDWGIRLGLRLEPQESE